MVGRTIVDEIHIISLLHRESQWSRNRFVPNLTFLLLLLSHFGCVLLRLPHTFATNMSRRNNYM